MAVCAARHAVPAVMLDAGQHLMYVASGAKLLDQLDWIKSMTNVTGVVHVLVQIPLAMEAQELMDHWYSFYEWSIGCVGVLKDCLVRTVVRTLHAHLLRLT